MLIGGEGMGKTSLLKLISGLEKQYFGDIIIDNINLKNHNHKSISFLPTEPVFLNGSLLKNLKFLFEIENKYIDIARKRLEDALQNKNTSLF